MEYGLTATSFENAKEKIQESDIASMDHELMSFWKLEKSHLQKIPYTPLWSEWHILYNHVCDQLPFGQTSRMFPHSGADHLVQVLQSLESLIRMRQPPWVQFSGWYCGGSYCEQWWIPSGQYGAHFGFHLPAPCDKLICSTLRFYDRHFFGLLIKTIIKASATYDFLYPWHHGDN